MALLQIAESEEESKKRVTFMLFLMFKLFGVL